MRSLAVVGVVAALASPAAADELTMARGQPVTEIAHRVAISLAGGVATYAVHREFLSSSTTADEMRLEITIPPGAVATGARIKSGDRWDDATLVDAAKAAATYRYAKGYDTDRVLVEWAGQQRLHLQAFPMLSGVTTIEYTLVAPARYTSGRYVIDYPRATGTCAESKPTRVFVPEVLTVDRDATVDGHAIAAGVATSLPCQPDASSPSDVEIGISPPPVADWTARLGRVVTSQQAFARLEIDVAPRLSVLPVRGQLVFVVDASYSMGDAGLAAELDTIRAYAHHLPDSEIEIVVYRRHATRVFGTFIPAAQLDARLRTAALPLANGSALDDGMRLATAALAGRSGPRRIIALTDEKLRPAFSAPIGLAALSALSPDTVVHVVVPGRDPRGSLKRSDRHPLAPLATSHHGIFAYLGLPPQPADTVLPLVRPTTIDRVSAPGLAVPASLDEGAGVRLLAEARAVPSHVILIGELWSDPIRRVVDVDPETSRSTAAFLIAADKTTGLERDDQMAIALVCSAVSPVTSYVAAGSRARPQHEADESGIEGGVCGCVVGGDPHGVIGPPPPEPPRDPPDLAAMIDARACHANRDVELTIDTTGDEIVDVAVHGPIDPISTCVADAAWRVRLDSRFDAPRDHFTVVVRAR
jgi:hypothetical protein